MPKAGGPEPTLYPFGLLLTEVNTEDFHAPNWRDWMKLDFWSTHGSNSAERSGFETRIWIHLRCSPPPASLEIPRNNIISRLSVLLS